MFTDQRSTVEAVRRIRLAFPAVYLYVFKMKLLEIGPWVNFCKLLWCRLVQSLLESVQIVAYSKNLSLQVPIYARAQNLEHLLDLKKAGATDAILEDAEVLLAGTYFSVLMGKYLQRYSVLHDDNASIHADKFTAWLKATERIWCHV